MISFNYETEFKCDDEAAHIKWLSDVIRSESKKEGDINYIFCDDEYLLSLNLKYLDHDTLTDIITFDYSVGNELHGDVFISVERVAENAVEFGTGLQDELRRVMVHGILHLSGYKDKSDDEERQMRLLEDQKLLMFHVEQ